MELQTKAKVKNDAARKHLQSFIDRFKAKASKARQAQSRVKALERMGTVVGRHRGSRPGLQVPRSGEGSRLADHRGRERHRRL